MNTTTTIIEQAAPAIAESYSKTVRATYTHLVERMGGADFKGIYNRREVFAFRAIEACMDKQFGPHGGPAMVCVLNEERLAAAAARHAETTVAEWAEKISAKMGELENAKAESMDGTGFLVSGTKNGHRVAIQQTMTVNVSSRGILFNQFPALIYVDGKKTAAAKYAAAVA